ncbi:hypothetical protein LTR85_011823 [Meristemomyces frigidus]|nr:hypothetical protein LTR85_011823 [Meristemomyces frigidus]
MIPVEVLAMFRLRSRVGAPESIVKIRNWRIIAAERRHRLYLEFCPYGDLYDFLGLDGRHGYQLSRESNEGSLAAGFPARVPEPYIWHTFELMATAGMLMEKGELDPEPMEIAFRDLIAHRDYKVSNLFLGLPLERRYRGYPTPELGDFGFAVIIPEGDKRKASDFNRAGTPGGMAPETVNPVLGMTTSATNCWGVGIVIWSLIELKEGDEGMCWGSKNREKRAEGVASKEEPQFSDDSREQYSTELLELVAECLSFDQADRPTFWDVLKRIRRYTRGGSENGRTWGLRDADKGAPAFKRDMRTDIVDKWALGSRLRELRRPPDGLGGLGGMPDPPGADDSSSDNDSEPGGDLGAEVGDLVAAQEVWDATLKGFEEDEAAEKAAAEKRAAKERAALDEKAAKAQKPPAKKPPAKKPPAKEPPPKKAPVKRKATTQQAAPASASPPKRQRLPRKAKEK